MNLADYEKHYPIWREKMHALLARRRDAKDDIERLQRDAAAARLAVLDAKLYHRDLEKQIDKLRPQRPQRP